MREFKFRAWNSYSRKMHYANEVSVTQHPYGKLWSPVMFEEHDVDQILMQYTGLKDKNGKEIYEGDIVQRYGRGKYKIYWHDPTACWRMDGHTGITKGDMALACEVIGNIYENGEVK